MSDALPLSLDTTGCIADTCYMTNEEAGAHFRLLILAWRSPGRCLPNDDGKLATILGVAPRKWARLKPIVMCLWHLSGGVWTHPRLQGPQLPKARKPRSITVPANANQPPPVRLVTITGRRVIRPRRPPNEG